MVVDNDDKSVNVNTEQEKESSTVKIDFKKESTVDDFIKKQTKQFNVDKEASGGEKKSIYENITSEDLRKDIKKSEDTTKAMTPKELEVVAGFLVTLYCTSLQNVCMAIASDSSSTAFAVAAADKQTLTTMLTFILVKYQARFKVEVIFIITLLMISYRPINEALKTKNRKKELQKQYEERLEKAASSKTPDKKEESKATPSASTSSAASVTPSHIQPAPKVEIKRAQGHPKSNKWKTMNMEDAVVEP